jgi:hypothetical protein
MTKEDMRVVFPVIGCSSRTLRLAAAVDDRGGSNLVVPGILGDHRRRRKSRRDAEVLCEFCSGLGSMMRSSSWRYYGHGMMSNRLERTWNTLWTPRKGVVRSHLIGILVATATLLGLRDDAANYKGMMHHHVLEVNLDEGSQMVRGIDEVVVDDKI